MTPEDEALSLLDKARDALLGNPARAIGYGAALVVVGVVAISNQIGYTRFGADIPIESALVLTTTAATTLVGIIEGIRRFVFSPRTVASILDEDARNDAPEGNG